MKRLLVGAMALVLGVIPVAGQSLEDLNIQIHGYATQGFLYTTHNNIFYTDSTDGSPAWTEAVLNLTAQPTPKLRVGVQARYFLLGNSGNAIVLDWAAADYRVNDRFGVRVGKVKTPWGLFNETQDIDPSYMWALLPQSIYDITTRNADLAHYGGVAYGTVKLSPAIGKVEYHGWGGESVIPTNDGQFADLVATGNGPLNPLTYVTYGGALHWIAPITGLMIGASDSKANKASVALTGPGSESFAPWNNLSYFGKYEKNKLMVAAEWNRQVSPGTLILNGRSSSASTDPRAWYAMAAYKITDKLSAGTYDSQVVDHQQPLGPDRYTKDWTVSGRYDFSQFIYLKAEQHFIQGTSLSFEDTDNTVLQPTSRLTVLKVGVSF